MRTENAYRDGVNRRRIVLALLPLAACLALGCADGRFFDRDRDDHPDPLTGLDRTRPDRRNVSVTGTGDGRTPASLAGTSGLGIRDTDPNSANSNRDRTVQTTGWTGGRTDDGSGSPKLGTPT